MRAKGTQRAVGVCTMRKVDFLFVTTALVSLGAALAIGCSNTEMQPEDEEEEQEQGQVSKPSTSSSSSSSSGAPANETPETDAGVVDPDASALTADAGATTVDTSACIAGSVVETESNDTAATANAFPGQTGTFCGSLSSALDTDFITFTLPAGTRGLGYGLKFNSGPIDATIVVNGQAFKLTQAIPLVIGVPYVLKVSGGAPLAYRFEMNVVR